MQRGMISIGGYVNPISASMSLIHSVRSSDRSLIVRIMEGSSSPGNPMSLTRPTLTMSSLKTIG